MSVSKADDRSSTVEQIKANTEYGDVYVQWFQTERLGLGSATADVTQHEPLDGRLATDEVAICIGYEVQHTLGPRVGETGGVLSSEVEFGFNIGDNSQSIGNDVQFEDQTTDGDSGYAGTILQKETLYYSALKSSGEGLTERTEEFFEENGLNLGPTLTAQDKVYMRSNPNSGGNNGIVQMTVKMYWLAVEIEDSIPEFSLPMIDTI